MATHHKTTPLEINTNMHALISWRSVVAGLLISMFTMIGLIGLGLAFGGIGLDNDTSMQSAGIFTGVWFVASALISLFIGSYFAARISKFRMGRIGSAQGLVIASLFIGFFLYQTFAALGSVGSAAGSLLGKSGGVIAQGAQQAANNPTVTNTINNYAEDALGDLNLRSDPKVVAQGVASRIVQGNIQEAGNYLSRQAGITPTEANARIAQVKNQIDQFLSEAKDAAAVALRSTGWTLFLLVVLGALSGIGGGALGSVANFRKPLIRESDALYPRGQTV